MDFSTGTVVKIKGGQLGTVIEEKSHGVLHFVDGHNRKVIAYPVLMEQGGEVRFFTADAFVD
jgi:hypothetical protein